MLIINADDLGRSEVATDRALRCFEKGRISSASAMVYMKDSERAAEMALSCGLDVGLHINFSERFSARSVPSRMRAGHERISRFLRMSKYALVLYHPRLAMAFRDVFEAQHTEFLRLYGQLPSHLDGHEHLHLATNVLIQKILPEGARVRRSFSFRPGERSFLNRLYRNAVDRWLQRRHQMTDYFFALSHHLAPDRLANVAALARNANVELMTHPERPAEFEFMMSEAFGECVSHVHLARRGATGVEERQKGATVGSHP